MKSWYQSSPLGEEIGDQPGHLVLAALHQALDGGAELLGGLEAAVGMDVEGPLEQVYSSRPTANRSERWSSGRPLARSGDGLDYASDFEVPIAGR